MRRITILVVFWVACFSLVSAAADEYYSGFVDGNDWRNLEPIEVLGTRYIQGVIDGFLYSPTLGASEATVDVIQNCLVDMPGGQIRAIVDKYMEDHPELWHEGMNSLVWDVIEEVCF